uniref:Uncharacterized protein n=1 Tax=Anopheles darlingi TaxID=43151 RepID=A0A2M4D0J1_ANODA
MLLLLLLLMLLVMLLVLLVVVLMVAVTVGGSVFQIILMKFAVHLLPLIYAATVYTCRVVPMVKRVIV